MKLTAKEKEKLEAIYQSFLHDEKILKMKEISMHRGSNCYEHSFKVAKFAIKIALRGNKKGLNLETLLIGAILHDYYLYDWRKDRSKLRKHSKNHPYIASENASRDFNVSPEVKKIIESHMWPFNFKNFPNTKEARIVDIADNNVAMCEALTSIAYKKRHRQKYLDYISHLFQNDNFMNVKLIKLTKEYQIALGEMIEEWKLDQQENHTDNSPWAIFRCDYHDFDKYLESLDYKEPVEGYVPDSTYFLLDIERNRLIGAVNIRHYLNEHLLKEGGHIGDGVRPSERRKGYATMMIRLALIECKKLGIDRVLICCDKNNIGSRKTIINNGGVLENEILDDEGNTIQRYWIENK